jgi:hypothetical protein
MLANGTDSLQLRGTYLEVKMSGAALSASMSSV